jgi:hypothetical protein
MKGLAAPCRRLMGKPNERRLPVCGADFHLIRKFPQGARAELQLAGAAENRIHLIYRLQGIRQR